MIRIVDQPELHRRGAPRDDPNIWLRYLPADWPKSLPRPPLPRCGATHNVCQCACADCHRGDHCRGEFCKSNVTLVRPLPRCGACG